MKLSTKSGTEKFRPGTKVNSERKEDVYLISPTAADPAVNCSVIFYNYRFVLKYTFYTIKTLLS